MGALGHVWIESADGELVHAEALVSLRMSGCAVVAHLVDGRAVDLTGPVCRADFSLRLLDELSSIRADDRWIVVIRSHQDSTQASWSQATTEQLIRRPDGHG